MKKKGFLGTEYFVALVLVVIFLIFGSSLIVRLGEVFKGKTSYAVCQASVLESSKSLPTNIDVYTLKVKCPTKYVTFHTAGYTEEEESQDGGLTTFENAEKKKKLVKYADENRVCDKKGLTEEQVRACVFHNVNSKISAEMKECWSKFYEGKLRVFSRFETGSQCIVCTNILFDNEMREEYGPLGLVGENDLGNPDYDLEQHMKDKPTGIKNDQGGDMSYYEFTLDLLDKNWELPIYDYEVGQDYAIVFGAMNEHFVKDVAGDIWNKIKSGWTGVPVENQPNYINTLHFIPNSEVPVYCSTWA